MPMWRWIGVGTLMLALTASSVSAATRASTPSGGTKNRQKLAATIIDSGTKMEVNNLEMFVTNKGSLAFDLENGNSGLFFPRRSGKNAIFAAGLWMGAKVNGDTLPDVAIGEYSQEYSPGPMLNETFQPDEERFRNYRISRGNTTSPDYLNWPVDQGAPTDALGNPLLLGDEMLWCVFNDADVNEHSNMNTDPLGVEVQQTVFAFNRAGALGNTIFVKWKLINKGGNQLDSMYVAFWSDPDLGGFTDDLVGCDTTRSLGFCYNATNNDAIYRTRPPAVGYDFFRGPIVEVSPGVYDTLGMSSFNKYINGTDPSTGSETYNYMKGLKPDGSLLHVNDDPGQPVTRYQVSGNPVTGSGWLDSNPADRRLMLSTGPFNMAPGDSQEIVAAVLVGQGTNALSSITDLKAKDDVAQLVFDLNFDIPAPPPPPTVYVQPLDGGVRLTWGSEPVGNVEINESLNQEFHFEGFRVWQLASNDPNADPTLVATYDIPNGVGSIYSDLFNPAVGTTERTLTVSGTDEGLEFSVEVTTDRIRGGKLVNNKDYYFAVTAYSYDINNAPDYIVGGVPIGTVSEVLESARLLTLTRVSPRSSSAVFSVSADPISSDPILNPDGLVSVEQLVQNDITGDRYRVTFDDTEQWYLTNLTCAGCPDTLLADQTNLSGDFDNPVVDGVMVRVAAPRGIAEFGELGPGGTILDMSGEATESTDTWHFRDFGGLDGFNWLHYADNHDYELRVLPDTTEHAWTYGSGEVSFVASYKVPFEIWDLGFNSLNDTADDVKMSVMARDRDLDGGWSWNDRVYFRNIPYASVAWESSPGVINPATKTTDYVADGSDQVYGLFEFRLDDQGYKTGNPDSLIPPPTTIRVIGRRFTSADAYEFTTARVGTAAGTVTGDPRAALKKILAVPNPYYARSQYELDQFNRIMRFTNIPASRRVTLRIFSLAGDLVRTLVREANTADEMSVAVLDWDLETDRELPVASGIYFYRIDVDGVGSKTDRIAVFIERERLDNF